MGVVYKARRPRREDFAALKVLAPDRFLHPDFPGRFEREAAVLAGLAHPNIVSFLEFGKEASIYFIALEYVEGETLRKILERGPLEFDRARSIALQICDALTHAHAKGIVHRDVKPENIMLDSRSCVKVTDFGLAKLTTGSLELTQSGEAMGTLRYMAPEQGKDSRDVDSRADVYSLGVVLQEMFAGHSGLDAVFSKSLARDRSRRYSTAAELKSDLARLNTKP